MKPLNRPMFRYGGPIKEGVMSGIREPKKDGGMLLVGQHPKEFKDASGREQHVAPIVYGAGLGLARLAPLAIRGARAVRNIFARPTPFQGPTGTVTQGGLNVARAKGRIPGASGSYSPINITRSPSTVTGSGAPVTQTGLKPTGFGSYLEGTMTGQAVKGLYKGATSAQAKGVTQKIGKGVWRVAKDPLTIASAAYYFYPDGTPKPEEEMQGPPPPGGLNKLLTDTGQSKDTGGGAEMSPKELRQSKIDKYRDIMDIKGMNKDAAYNSLIAASQAINESGDFKGDIKSGKLINQIIQATSKQFDKPKATKDAIDTLILKGEIEKDIKASDPSSKIANELNLARIDKLNKELEGNSFAEAKAIMRKAGSKGQNEITDAAKSLEDVNYQGTLISKSDFKDVIETAKNTLKTEGGTLSEEQIIEGFATNFIVDKNAPDGEYIVGDAIISIRDGQVVPGSVRR